MSKIEMKLYPVKELFNSRIILSPCPQGYSDLNAEISALTQYDVSLVISMLTNEEQRKHGLLNEKEMCRINGIQYYNFPIRDEIADSDIETISFVKMVSSNVLDIMNNTDKKVLFHCRGGVGRSSMMITLVMSQLGYHVDEVFQFITSARGEQAPESTEQLKWVQKLANSKNIWE